MKVCEAAKPCMLLLARLTCMCVYNVKKLSNNPLCLLNAWQFERASTYCFSLFRRAYSHFQMRKPGLCVTSAREWGLPLCSGVMWRSGPRPKDLNTIHGYFRSPARQPCQGLGGALGSTSFSVPIGAESPWAPFSVKRLLLNSPALTCSLYQS